MKRLMAALILVFTLVTAGHVWAARKTILVYDSEKAMQIKDTELFGVTLSMTMKEIQKSMKSRGYEVSCYRGACSVSKENISFSFMYNPGRADEGPLEEDREVEKLNYSLSGKDSEDCPDVYDIAEKFCVLGLNRFPCKQDDDLIVAFIWPVTLSSDGWRYKAEIRIDPSRQCRVSFEKHKK